jgi:hypothetical protein
MSKYAWPKTYCHGNDDSYRIVVRWHRKPGFVWYDGSIMSEGSPFPYESTVGPFIRKDGTKGWSVAWILWARPKQKVCPVCGFIFQGVIT